MAILPTTNRNPPIHPITIVWRNPSGTVIPFLTGFPIAQISNVREEDAGVYTCTYISSLTGESHSVEITLIVERKSNNNCDCSYTMLQELGCALL